MVTKKYDVFGLGNALVDFLVEVDDNLLKELNLTKGRFHQVTNEHSKEIINRIKYSKAKICSGGSCANAIAALGLLGSNAIICSKIGEDEHGYLFEKEANEAKVISKLSKSNTHPTGHCIVLITPDAERTFVVNYGAATTLQKHELPEQEIKESKILHIDGYLIPDKHMKEIALHAIKIAKQNNTKISLDLGDAGIVKNNREEFKNLIKEFVDILFADDDEAFALTNKQPEEAINEIAEWCNIAIVKLGAKGSIIKSKSETNNKIIKISAVKTNAIDTTGAGDAYAAGFLHGLTHSMTLEESGNLGSMLGAKAVSQIGARLSPNVIKEF